MSDIRNRPNRLYLNYIPKEIQDKKAICPDCKMENEISWTFKNIYPKQPIPTKDNKGHWVPTSISIECSNKKCKKQFHYPVERQKIKGEIIFYGDEAERIVKQKDVKSINTDISFFCISLVTCHSSRHEELKVRFNKIKKIILPEEEPENWTLHFKEIWSPNRKNKHKFAVSKATKIAYANEFADILREFQPELGIFNFSGVWELPDDVKARKVRLKHQKEYIYSQSLVSSLDETRLHEMKIKWFFDYKKDSTKKERKEGWADEIFLGLQYTNLFTWYSAGATVEEPNFVKPGSHFLLEIADFYSFWTARGFLQMLKNQKSELPIEKLGKIMAQANDIYGNSTRLNLGEDGKTLEDLYGLKAKKNQS